MKKIWVLSIILTITAMIGFACSGDAALPTTPPTATSPAPAATSPAVMEPMATTAVPSGGGDAELGQQLATSNTCIACHTADGSSSVGPTWKGLYGSTRELEGGSTVTADEAYLEESIKNPTAKVALGFAPVMVQIPLEDDQVKALIAYIKSLK